MHCSFYAHGMNRAPWSWWASYNVANSSFVAACSFCRGACGIWEERTLQANLSNICDRLIANILLNSHFRAFCRNVSIRLRSNGLNKNTCWSILKQVKGKRVKWDKNKNVLNERAHFRLTDGAGVGSGVGPIVAYNERSIKDIESMRINYPSKIQTNLQKTCLGSLMALS